MESDEILVSFGVSSLFTNISRLGNLYHLWEVSEEQDIEEQDL